MGRGREMGLDWRWVWMVKGKGGGIKVDTEWRGGEKGLSLIVLK